MAYNVSNNYKNIIYSEDTRNKIKILFNNVELQDADLYCEKFTVKPRIIPNGAKIFSLCNFVSKEAELILHNVNLETIQNPISISIGTLVGSSYEYVPIGIFNIQDEPTTDKNKTTIKLRDNSIKFDFNYNAKPLIDDNGGTATKLQILQDICTKAGVTCNISSFIGSTDNVGIYDNTITARQYIAYLAEQAGKIATINRSGELIFVDLNNLSTWNIPLSLVEKYEMGKSYKIGQVIYEDGIVKYETSSSAYDILYLDASNPYVSSQSQVDSILTQVNTFEIDSVKTGKILGNPAIDGYDLINIYDDKTQGNPSVFKTLATNELVYNGKLLNTFDTQIGEEAREQNTTILGEPTFKKWAKTEINNINGEILIQAGEIDNLQKEVNPTDTATGSTIYLEDSAEAPLINFELEGKTTQETSASPVMPSPDYPSDIVSVGNGNLFDNKFRQGSASNLSTTNRLYSQNDIFVEQGKEYTISTNLDISIYRYAINISKTAHPNNAQTQDSGWKRVSSFTFTANLSGYLGIPISKIANTDLTLDDLDGISFRVEEGDKVNNYNVKIKMIRKNLINFDDFLNYCNSVYTKSENVYSITNIGNASTYRYPLLLQKNTTYSLSCIPITNQTSNVRLQIYKNGTYFGRIRASDDTEKSFIFTTGENDKFTMMLTYTGTLISSILFDSIMLEKGSTATTYEPYKENIYTYTLNEPLRAIGNYKDKLYIDNGMLYVERKIGKIIYKGNNEENWAYSSNAERYSIHLTDIALEDWSNTTPVIVKSNYFNGSTWYKIYRETLDNVISSHNITHQIIIKSTEFGSLENFKTWLSTHNTEVNYVLATSVNEELGEVTIPSTYKGITYIDTTDELEPNMSIEYVRDTQITDYVEKHIAQIKVNEEGITQRVETIEDSDYGGRISAVEQKQTDTDVTIDIISTNIDKTNGNVKEVTTETGFTFNATGMSIKQDDFEILQTPQGAYYKEGNNIVGQYTKDGSKQKDLALFGVYYYGMKEINSTPMFVAQLYNDENGEECFGHFFNGEV